VTLEVHGLSLVPAQYQAAVKNVAIQFIRNAVMHGVETPAAARSEKQAASRHFALGIQKPARRQLRTAVRGRWRRLGS